MADNIVETSVMSYLGKKYIDKLLEVAKTFGLLLVKGMDGVTTAAIWTDSRVH